MTSSNTDCSAGKFLYKDRKNQTGILQRFVDPAGGGTNNSQIRAICTPKMCVLERRKTKQSLHDTRYGIYERTVTFEGPEVFSTLLPIRGAALPKKLRHVCDKVLSDVSEAMINASRKSETKDDLRMVLNLKVDCKERVWILYSSSIRSLPGQSQFVADIPSYKIRLSKSNELLNTQNVIALSSSAKLCQNANHDPSVKISNKKSFSACPSCGNRGAGETFHPVPYKTIISHFEHLLAISEKTDTWPPTSDIIKSAGGVGFGTCTIAKGDDVKDEDLVIPPVIRHLHQRLKVEGYRRYRSDPLFLHKQCEVCEDCFLAYAKLVSTSFQIILPIKTDTVLETLGFASLNEKIMLSSKPSLSRREKRIPEREKKSSSFMDLFVQCPSLPKAIVDPPALEPESGFNKFLPLSSKYIGSPQQPLIHMISMQQKLPRSKIKEETAIKNPYEETMKIVDTSRRRKKCKKLCVDSNSFHRDGVAPYLENNLRERLVEKGIGYGFSSESMT